VLVQKAALAECGIEVSEGGAKAAAVEMPADVQDALDRAFLLFSPAAGHGTLMKADIAQGAPSDAVHWQRANCTPLPSNQVHGRTLRCQLCFHKAGHGGHISFVAHISGRRRICVVAVLLSRQGCSDECRQLLYTPDAGHSLFGNAHFACQGAVSTA
jgi:hypothetical protein